MKAYVTEEMMTAREAPIGLLRLEKNGELILKTEYFHPDGTVMAYIADGGERFCGDGDEALCRAVVVK